MMKAPVAVADFLADLKVRGVPRVPGTAVFLTRTTAGIPPVMIWHLQHNRALHERVLVLTIITESKPRIRPAERMSVAQEGDQFWRLTAHYGFMERPDIPLLLQDAHDCGCGIQLDDLIFYVGHESIVHRERGDALPIWQEELFAVMVRNASHVTDYFRLPSRQVVEIGRQISI
jgi:KUP system potassium uptake protein